MAEATILQSEVGPSLPGQEVVLIEVSDGETYNCRRLSGIEAAHFQPNRAPAASDSWGVTFTRGAQVATIELVGTVTDVTGTLVLYGK